MVHDCVNSRLQNRAEHGVFSFMNQVSSRSAGERDNKQKRGAWGKVGQSRQHACWNSACAMGITRFQINFGES